MDVFEKICQRKCVAMHMGTRSMNFLLEFEKDENPDVPQLALLAAATYGETEMLQLILESTRFDQEILAEALEEMRLDNSFSRSNWLNRLLVMKSLLQERLN